MIENNDDIRWKQRLDSFLKAFARLTEAVELKQQRKLSRLEQQGLIKAFEFTHELAWNVIKDYAFYQGQSHIMGSRDATRYAFKLGLIMDGDGWMDMIINRNKAVHTYDEATAIEVTNRIFNDFYPLFNHFKDNMQKLSNES
ncbi:MAG: nucleotidyltransferase [Kangiella sp.]|nr:MAG: nucleotidyltransferase [Kangiella sp.]